MATRTETLRLVIDGEEVKNSYTDLQKAQRQVAKEMKGLEQGTDAYIKKSQQLNSINKRLQEVKGDINKIGNEWKKQQAFWGNVKSQLIGTFTGIGLAQVTQQAGQMVKQFIQFAKELAKQRKEVTQLTGATGEYLDIVTAKVQSLSDTFEKDFKEVLVASNAFSKSMGIDAAHALDLIQQGFAGGADISGEFLDMLKEYSPQFKAAGLSAEQSIRIIQTQVKEGIYSDKGVDVIKEATLRIREMPKATQEAIDAIGLSGSEIQKELTAGNITVFDAIQMVSRRLGELPAQSSVVGTAIADIFGGPGEDAGLEYIKMLGNVETELSEVEQGTYDLIKANEALNKALNDLTKDGGGLKAAETGWTKFKAALVQNIANVFNSEAGFFTKVGALMGHAGAIYKLNMETLTKDIAAQKEATDAAEIEAEKKKQEELAAIRAKETKDKRDLATQRATGSGLAVSSKEIEELETALRIVEISYAQMEEAITAKNKEQSDLRNKLTAQELAIKEEAAAKQIDLAIQAGVAAADSSETFVGGIKNVLNAIRDQLKAELAIVVATQLRKALVNVPFPLNIIAAPIAAAGASALFNQVVPSFYHGGPTGSNSIGFGDKNGPYTGYTHADEFVLSKAHRQDPVVASTESYVESTRRYGQAGAAAAGAAPLSVNATTSLDAAQFQDGVMKFREAVSVLQQIRIKAEFSGKAFEDADEYVQEKQNNRNRGRISGS